MTEKLQSNNNYLLQIHVDWVLPKHIGFGNPEHIEHEDVFTCKRNPFDQPPTFWDVPC